MNITNFLQNNKLAFYLTLLIIALLTPLAFAPYYQFWLMPVLFAALIYLLQTRLEKAVKTAYLFGLVAYTCQFYWVHTALHDVSGLPNLYAIPLTFLLPAYLAIFPALAVWLWRKCRVPSADGKTGAWHEILALPIFWTLAEFARERVLTGFGWGALGYSQIADYSPLAGFAPLGGIHLVTLITAFFGAGIYVLFMGNRTQRLMQTAFLLVLLAIGLVAKNTEFTASTGEKSSVALAQGNIAQSLKFQADQFANTVERYFQQVTESKADIVVLPETAIPAMLQDLPADLIPALAIQAQQNGSALAVGVARYTDDKQGYFNAMLNLSDLNLTRENWQSLNPEQIEFYAKNHLVPFGEYKPLPFLTEPLYRMMNMPLADFQRGGASQKPFVMHKQKVAFNICYEDGFGDELIGSAKQSTLLANASNMAWYGDSNAMYQQLQQSQARALELGRFMVRATNTGATAIVNHQGKVLQQLPINTTAVLTGEIEGRTGETPYMKIGSSYPLMMLLAVCGVLLWFKSRKSCENAANKQ
ncbi:MAG: apolipoprotein N-acyltransferase [Neisseria sp.]|nr:apolipoprotein N-acyltransferase [Neisseria sp.]